MEKAVVENDIYEIAENILIDIFEVLSNGIVEDKIADKILKFLTTDKYDRFFKNYSEVQTKSDIQFYKKIMMLIIFSTSYKVVLHDMINDLSYDASYQQSNDLEELEPSTIYRLFYEKDNELIYDCLFDYINHIESNYIYQNDCLENVIKEDKLDAILKINPFEVLRYLDYIDPNKISDFERDLQTYIDLQYKAIADLMDEKEECEDYDFRDALYDLICEKYNNDSARINKFYGYIFGNVYENLKIDSELSKEYPGLIKYFEDESINFNQVMDRYNNDIDFFHSIYEIFLETNSLIDDGELAEKRQVLKEFGGYGILKKFNSYYEEEEIIFGKCITLHKND